MLRNYLKIAWRNLAANSLFTSLNIAGLAIGICVCISLFACILYEWSFDRMYKNQENIYRVNMQTSGEYNNKVWAKLPNSVGPAMLRELPQVKQATRLIKHDFGATVSIKTDDKNFVEKGLYMADEAVFTMFDFNFVEGSAAAAFSQPKSIVISQAAKERLYGNAPAIGKAISINNRDTLHVSGVYQDLPENSTIDCDMVYNIMETWAGKDVYWSNASYETYCLLQPGANVAQVQQQATMLIEKNVAKDDRFFTRFILQPLASVHLYSSDIREGYTSRVGSIGNVKALLFLSILVLVIACINYMNLATARSQKRAKGVGVNKVLGANTGQLLLLFYVETAVLSAIAIVIGYGLAYVVQPVFQGVTGISLKASSLYAMPIMFCLLGTWLVVTVVAGSYPALSMSQISPLVLMNKLKLKYSAADMVRKLLVVLQFSSSIVLIIAVIIVLQQMNFIKNKDLGYTPSGVVALSIKAAQNKDEKTAFINNLKGIAGVESVTAVQSIPGDVESGRSLRRSINDKEGYPVKTCQTDAGIVKTMRLKLSAGTTLPESVAAGDTVCYAIVNEAIIKYLGFKSPQDAVGRYIRTELSDRSKIVGVVQDFNYQSLRDEVGAYMYYTMNNAPEPLRNVMVRFNTADISGIMQRIQQSFKQNLPNAAFDYQFLDTHIDSMYTAEQHTANTATVFSLLAIFVACLGLFGLAAFTAEQRTKEIGVRKVLGASVTGITKLLTTDFLKLVAIAVVIASPVAWYMMNQWLQGFSYRIHISWMVFALASLTAIIFAVLTVSSHAIKAALANPVKSLRTE